MRIEQQRIYDNPSTGVREVTRTQRDVVASADRSEAAYRIDALVWYVIGIIETLLVLRMLFLLLGARVTGFTAWLYDITAPLIAPFRGIFPTPTIEGAYFDTVSLVAMIVYALIGWAITALIDAIANPTDDAL